MMRCESRSVLRDGCGEKRRANYLVRNSIEALVAVYKVSLYL